MRTPLTFFNSSDTVFPFEIYNPLKSKRASPLSKIVLNPLDLFPQLPAASHSYTEAQEHSVLVDAHLGFHTEEIERKLIKDWGSKSLESDVQAWVGLPVQAMQTPYTEIRQILDLLSPAKDSTVVDLGCAYGRMAHVVGHHYPGVSFVGYELVDERVQEGNRVLSQFHYPSCHLITADLSDAAFVPPLAEYYFIFDFGSRPAIEKILNDLKKISLKKEITVVARGRGIRNWIYQGHPWLYAIQEPQIFDHFSIFRP